MQLGRHARWQQRRHRGWRRKRCGRGHNSFRMPINEPTVNTAAKWNAYKAIIDVGVSKGMKVVLSFWAKDTGIGKPANNPSSGNTWSKQLLDRSSQGNYSRTIVGEWGTGVRGTNFGAQGTNGAPITYSIQNQSGMDRIWHSWGLN